MTDALASQHHPTPKEGDSRARSPRLPAVEAVESPRLLSITAICVAIGVAGGVIAKALLMLIALITGLTFHRHLTTTLLAPDTHNLGPWVTVVPVVGGIIIGAMARYGSAGIRGHGIPEVMARVLHGESRISPRLMVLKPLSAAIAIGTGGPFGAEGPIIATGGAMGSLVGQVARVTAEERKTFLAAGAAAGMAATFGTPVSAVLLAIELLLFEYRARSIIPMALAASAATAVRALLIAQGPMFAMAPIGEPPWTALAAYVVIGAGVGLLAVMVTKSIYAIEDTFERLPIHWMWWPAIGAVAVGLVGWADPRILGVGYQNIDGILTGSLAGVSLLALVVLKFAAWSVYLGSGTSGGTLAPLFIIGGGAGALLGGWLTHVAPGLGVSPSVAGLVGMAAIFAGASHALLASIVFAFEATRQPLGLLPLLAGGSTAYLVSILLMRTSIMTERLARRGALVRPEYAIDFLASVLVRDVMTRNVLTLDAESEVRTALEGLSSGDPADGPHGLPVVTQDGILLGVLTRRDLRSADAERAPTVSDLLQRPAVAVLPHHTLRTAADHMVREGVSRLPVLEPDTHRLIGIVTKSDLLAAHEHRLRHAYERSRTLFPRDGEESKQVV